MEFPIDIGTIPFRIPNGPTPQIKYGECVPIVMAVVCLSNDTHLDRITFNPTFTNGHAIHVSA